MSAVNDVDPITIRLRDQMGKETLFKINRWTKMSQIYEAHAQITGTHFASWRLLFSGEYVEVDQTPQMLGIEDGDLIDAMIDQAGMISTFTSSDSSDILTNYLMMTDQERAPDTVPIAELRKKASKCEAKPFLTFHYEENPKILHESQRKILCELLECVWEETATEENRERVDMRLNLTSEQLISVLAPLDAFLDNEYKSACLDEKFSDIYLKVRNANSIRGHKIALRMTCGPTNSCIDFHCDGDYATSTSQIPLNSESEYKGGVLCFFVNDHVHKVPRIPGSLVQHPPQVLHGVTSVTKGTRKSLFIVDRSNGLGQEGVIDVTSDHVVSFLLRDSSRMRGKKRPR